MFNMLTTSTFKPFPVARKQMAGVFAGAALLAGSCGGAVAAGGAPPSTFGSTIGQALLCVDHIDPYYFWSYLNQFFGPPYKTEGGAYWFKVQGTLWGATITDVMVSDGASELVFLAASFKDSPAKLSAAIAGVTGIRYLNEVTIPFSPFVSDMGSKIIYAGQGAKIYCEKYNLDYARQHLR